MANLPEHPKKLAHVLHSLAHALSVHKRFLRSSGICPGNPIDFADWMRGFQLDPQGEHSKKRPSRYLAVPKKPCFTRFRHAQSLKHSRYSNGVRARMVPRVATKLQGQFESRHVHHDGKTTITGYGWKADRAMVYAHPKPAKLNAWLYKNLVQAESIAAAPGP